jgi:glycerate kinase
MAGPSKPLEIERLPVADGGEVTAEAIHDALAGRWVTLVVRDPIGRTVESRYARVGRAGGERLALLQMSSASGYSLVRGDEGCWEAAAGTLQSSSRSRSRFFNVNRKALVGPTETSNVPFCE